MAFSFYLSAFLTGVLGSTHCIAMCGGIACILGSKVQSNQWHERLSLSLSFNFGRIISYSIAGAIVAGSVAAMQNLYSQTQFLFWLQFIAAIMMILLGIHLTRFLSVLAPLERTGQVLWRYLQPIASTLLGKTGHLANLQLGLVWGWLPCGLVYSNLSLAATQASATKGALLMFCFGLGTLTIMTLSVLFGQQLSNKINSRFLQIVTGILICGFGTLQLINLL